MELSKEREYLKTVREKEVADMIKEARSFGDLSENSEYDEAKNEQGRVFSRIRELDDILSNYTIISEDTVASDTVGPGSHVTVRDMSDGSEDSFYIVGSQEADPAIGRISDESPFGRALIGRKAGEEVTVAAPAGTTRAPSITVEAPASSSSGPSSGGKSGSMKKAYGRSLCVGWGSRPSGKPSPSLSPLAGLVP